MLDPAGSCVVAHDIVQCVSELKDSHFPEHNSHHQFFVSMKQQDDAQRMSWQFNAGGASAREFLPPSVGQLDGSLIDLCSTQVEHSNLEFKLSNTCIETRVAYQ